MTSWDDLWRGKLEAWQREDRLRLLPEQESPSAEYVTIGGQRLLNLCSNNYLGLAHHPRLRQAAIKAVEEYGTGATASRLVVGNPPLYATLETELAAWKGAEAALVFGSGYAANLGLLSALAGHGDTIFADRLNHASLIDGARLSGATLERYPHSDVAALRRMLENAPAMGKRLIVTDTVFSMDGDLAPLADLVALAEEFNCLLVVDEAHAVGLFGAQGQGLVQALGLGARLPVQMGTLSKALGGYGGYVAGSGPLIQYLENSARSLIFSTALPPAVLGAALEAVRLLRESDELCQLLRERVQLMSQALGEAGLLSGEHHTPIFPLLAGENAAALEWSRRLRAEGLYVQAIRPPTVPPGTARLRLTVMATHAAEDLRRAAEILARTRLGE